MPKVADKLLPKPNKASSRRDELRYRNKGSFSVSLSKGTWADFEAGEGGGVLALIRREQRTDTAGAFAWLRSVGILAPAERDEPVEEPSRSQTPPPARKPASSNLELAAAIWRESVDPRGTIVEAYLASRGLSLTAELAGDVLRFHRRCPFGPGERHPCLVALMRGAQTNDPCGIHRTALDGHGRKIGRKMLGQAEGGAIKLSNNADVTLGLGIAEGIETALSVLQAGWAPVWAVGDAGRVARFPILGGIEGLTIFADADTAGMKAARDCAGRWVTAGREVFIQRPSQGDFNDLFKGAANA
jgi:hypothetical protein